MGTNPGRAGVTVIKGSKGLNPMTKFYAFFQSFMVSARESESGQTMAEYAVVLAVITVAIVVTLGLLAGGINSTLNSVTAKL